MDIFSNGIDNIHNARYWSDEKIDWLYEIDNQYVWSLNI